LNKISPERNTLLNIICAYQINLRLSVARVSFYHQTIAF